ncbi:hypothetical protein BKA67DRAFT_668115 [Truncatella angustata]|uniref:Uncharacterized protein n=1 Tax=Truncatella angustata TaxID=152316 RepID=A0A9P8V050_9PEZI|nr:uncharacterized protein BKA67DRAFT_668115 [Truncatella angustata]KAH6661176.1 hypothetical protein BKA67DRAFT_668115 [Truncatella angustata]
MNHGFIITIRFCPSTLGLTCFDNPKRIIENTYVHMKPSARIEFHEGSADISSYSNAFEGNIPTRQWADTDKKGRSGKQWWIEAGWKLIIYQWYGLAPVKGLSWKMFGGLGMTSDEIEVPGKNIRKHVLKRDSSLSYICVVRMASNNPYVYIGLSDPDKSRKRGLTTRPRFRGQQHFNLDDTFMSMPAVENLQSTANQWSATHSEACALM